MSLRWRIALGLAIIAALVAGLAAAGAYVTTSRQLYQAIDDSLLNRTGVDEVDRDARELVTMAPITSGPEDTTAAPQPGTFVAPSETSPRLCPPPAVIAPATAAQIVDADGDVVVCFEEALALPVRDAAASEARRTGQPVLETVSVDGESYRVLTAALPDGSLFQVARSRSETEDILTSLQLKLVLLGAAGVLLAALVGWWFAGRLVRPIDRLRLAAEQIARTEDLEVPIPQTGTGEVKSLTASFSTMVRALARSREQQHRLIVDASHELRTPLTSLRTNAQLLEREDRLTCEQRARASHAIAAEVDELTDLVAELVELSSDPRLDAEPRSVVHLHALAHEVVERASLRTDRTITVDHTGDDTVEVEPGSIERAIANLVDNALKYGEGPVVVSIDGRSLRVRDRGRGIPPDDLPLVFERFHRSVAARTQPGSGLGLSIVAQVVERHGGTVDAANDPGGGAVVGFTLPTPAPASA